MRESGPDGQFGEWLTAHLESRAEPRRRFARRIGVSATTVGRWAAGWRPTKANCIRVAQGFDAKPSIVLELAGHDCEGFVRARTTDASAPIDESTQEPA
jgi:transcriptional regulator with XRE-family HTH domain